MITHVIAVKNENENGYYRMYVRGDFYAVARTLLSMKESDVMEVINTNKEFATNTIVAHYDEFDGDSYEFEFDFIENNYADYFYIFRDGKWYVMTVPFQDGKVHYVKLTDDICESCAEYEYAEFTAYIKSKIEVVENFKYFIEFQISNYLSLIGDATNAQEPSDARVYMSRAEGQFRRIIDFTTIATHVTGMNFIVDNNNNLIIR